MVMKPLQRVRDNYGDELFTTLSVTFPSFRGPSHKQAGLWQEHHQGGPMERKTVTEIALFQEHTRSWQSMLHQHSPSAI